MRMSSRDLGGDVGDDVGHRELAGCGGDLRLQDDLEQKVAQLFAQRRRVVLVDGLERLVGFLQEMRAESLRGLFAVPGTALWGPQVGDDVLEAFEGGGTWQRRDDQARMDAERFQPGERTQREGCAP